MHYPKIKRENEYLKNQCIQYIYDLCIEEKIEYLERICMSEQVRTKEDKQNLNNHYFLHVIRRAIQKSTIVCSLPRITMDTIYLSYLILFFAG